MQANEYYSKPNIFKRIALLIGNIVFYIVILAIIVCGIIGVVGKIKGVGGGFGFGGYNAYVVASNSMYAVHPDNFRKEDIEALGDTQFSRGELIIVRNLRDSDELKDLDIVTFPQDGVIIVHRIVGIYTDSNGTTFYVTQGDANNNTDGDRTRNEFKGIFVKSLGKGAGTFVSFLQSGWGIAAIAMAIAVVIGIWLVYDAIKDKEKPREPADLPESAAAEDAAQAE